MLFEALTTRKTVTVGERLIVPYKLAEVGLQLYICCIVDLYCKMHVYIALPECIIYVSVPKRF